MLRSSQLITLLLVATVFGSFVSRAGADAPLFSGPQPGEKMPGFSALRVFGDSSGDEFDFIETADGKPTLLIFFHEKTRPALGLTNAITKFAATRSKSGLKTCVVFLADDHTEIMQWAKNIRKHLTEGVTYAVSPDRIEGPGNYGLNRNVKLTILVGKNGKVTKNFAIGQPQLEVDGPAILAAIADVSGGGKVPTVAQLADRSMRRMRDNPMREEKDAKLASLLRNVINKQASADQVKESAKAVETYVAENANAKKELARITNTIVSSGKLANYGTAAAQVVLKRWAKANPQQIKEKADVR